MKLQSYLPAPGPALYIAPLLNTLLLLVVFFLLGSSFVVQSGLSVALPTSGSKISGFKDALVVAMTASSDGEFFLNGKPMTLDELKLALSQAKPDQRRLVIHADQRSLFGRVMTVSSVALALGYEIAYATTPEEDNAPR
jgi:biopolymer transport protein ExbD